MKDGIKRIVDYTLTNEFKIIVMVVMFCLIILFFMGNMILVSITEDLTKKIHIQAEEYEELKIKHDDLQEEYNYIRSFNEELIDNLKELERGNTQ